LLGVSTDVSLVRIAPGPFQSQVEPVSGQVREHLDLMWLQFGLAAPGHKYGPLYVTTRCRSTAANYGMLATPESFRLIQSPLGAASSPRLPDPSCHPVAGWDFR